MAYTIAFFGSKPYDEASFNEKNSEYGFELRYYKGHLNLNNVILTQGVDAVCIFVNDTADAEVIRQMAANGVKLLALRCAGYNNVDLKAAAENGITVVRVPAYSPMRWPNTQLPSCFPSTGKYPAPLGVRATGTSRCMDFWDSTCTARQQVSSGRERLPKSSLPFFAVSA